ncbi:MAG: MFS transporter [Hyphomonas sp.]|uniref:MFS transporter n=1 Tax=Hyphomonas sp. TaxID=87 RepID=UPI0030019EEA
MNPRILCLVFAPFAFGTSAFVFIGLIDPMAEGLGVGVPLIGQLQMVFAIACGVGGPFLARLLSGVDRKRLLVGVLVSMVAMNFASALAPDFVTLAGLRFLGGFFAALTIPLATTIGVNMVPEARRPDAIAAVMAGYTLAFLLGMPLGTILGDAFGWRAAFWFAGGVAVVAALLIALVAPGNVKAPHLAGANFKTALSGENPKLMAITMLGFVATFVTVGYIGPVITQTTGLTGAAIGGVQIATGIGSLIGVPVGALFARLDVRKALFILFVLAGLTQVAFALGMRFDFGGLSVPFLIVTMALGSAALFATTTVVQARLAATSGAAVTIAFALNSSMVYFGQGVGATLGGGVIAAIGLSATGIAGAGVAIFALALVLALRVESARP